MEKLIELLYKYNEEKEGKRLGLITSVKENDEEIWFDKKKEVMKYECEIISKSYGFIKWLVDNDKIDLDKLKDNTSLTMLTHSIGLGCEWHTAHEGESILRAIGTNAIIAYLSIQDEPIKFLISILK